MQLVVHAHVNGGTMYIKIDEPLYENNYRLLLELRYKGNRVDFQQQEQELKEAINYYNEEVKKQAHLNTKQIFAVDIFANHIAIFLSSGNENDEPAKGIQLFSSYFTKNATIIGNSCRNGKLFVKAEDAFKLSNLNSNYALATLVINILQNPEYDNHSTYAGLKREEIANKIEIVLREGFIY